MYLYDKNRITYFAETDRRNKRVPFGIKAEDRTRHMYIIGKTGMGKSTIIENMVVQDIKNGEGFAFIDPHGKSAALLLDYIPPERLKDVVYLAPFDVEHPISFNVMEDVGPDKRHLVANGLMSAFKKIWGPETWSARMEYILMNSLLALLEYPGSTLLGVSRMLTDKEYRKKVVDNIKDPSVKSYWIDEFAKYSETYAKEAVPGIQNKLGQFTSNPLIRNIIGQEHSSFDLRQMMDDRKIFIVNLSKGQLGEGNANLLGGMIITKIYLAAMSRADLTDGELKKLPNFYMYVDEFQSFANESFADILSEARKYKLALVVAHQYIKQMDEKVADAVFGNVGTQIMFRVGAPDAEVLEKEYAPVFTIEDMVSLGMYQIYLKLMIDGVASHPFSAVTLGPIALPPKSIREEVIASSRALYGHPRAEVEKSIAEWYGTGNQAAAQTAPPRVTAAAPASVAPRTENPPRATAAPRTEYPPRATAAPVAQRAPVSAPVPSHIPAPAIQKSSMLFERERHHSREADDAVSQPSVAPVNFQQTHRETPIPPKTEKPFAQAFKNIPPKPTSSWSGEPSRESGFSPKSEPRAEHRDTQTARLTHPQTKSGSTFSHIGKGSGPSSPHLSSLKAALADAINKDKKPATTISVSTPKPISTPAHVQPAHQAQEKPVHHKQQEQTLEEKVADVAAAPKSLFEMPPEKVYPVRDREGSQRESDSNGERELPPEPAKIKEVPEDVLTALLRGDE